MLQAQVPPTPDLTYLPFLKTEFCKEEFVTQTVTSKHTHLSVFHCKLDIPETRPAGKGSESLYKPPFAQQQRKAWPCPPLCSPLGLFLPMGSFQGAAPTF